MGQFEVTKEEYASILHTLKEIDARIEHTQKLKERMGRTHLSLSGIRKNESNYAGLYYALKQQYENLSTRTILHLGCSHGLFIDILQSDEHCKTYGIDYNKTTVNFTRDNLDIPVIYGNFFELSKYMSGKLVDAVVAEELLVDRRHSEIDINHGFTQIKKILKPAGCFFIQASNFRNPVVTKRIAFRHGFTLLHEYTFPNETYTQVFQAPLPVSSFQ